MLSSSSTVAPPTIAVANAVRPSSFFACISSIASWVGIISIRSRIASHESQSQSNRSDTSAWPRL